MSATPDPSLLNYFMNSSSVILWRDLIRTLLPSRGTLRVVLCGIILVGLNGIARADRSSTTYSLSEELFASSGGTLSSQSYRLNAVNRDFSSQLLEASVYLLLPIPGPLPVVNNVSIPLYIVQTPGNQVNLYALASPQDQPRLQTTENLQHGPWQDVELDAVWDGEVYLWDLPIVAAPRGRYFRLTGPQKPDPQF